MHFLAKKQAGPRQQSTKSLELPFLYTCNEFTSELQTPPIPNHHLHIRSPVVHREETR